MGISEKILSRIELVLTIYLFSFQGFKTFLDFGEALATHAFFGWYIQLDKKRTMIHPRSSFTW